MQKNLFEDQQLEVYSVSEIVGLVKGCLDEEVGEVLVTGEISNCRMPASGHVYFTLKDPDAQLRCVLFRFYKERLRFRMEDGIEVVCEGKLTVYEPRGDLQLIATSVEPKGFGALQLAFEQLKERLASEGLFDETRKKSIPLLPKRIGVVTSATGAAIRDILNVLGRRNERVSIVIAPCKVQG
ncbi:exodeoxyribonuclease VII large subunit, partial [Acidobacteriota bacterium]